MHRDINNVGPSFIKSFGEFIGGRLYYYPEDYNCYTLLQGNYKELYKITNYENIELKSKEISLYYPDNMSNMLTTILREWVQDISQNQINKIIKGTKFSIAVDNLPVNYTKDLVKNLSSDCTGWITLEIVTLKCHLK